MPIKEIQPQPQSQSRQLSCHQISKLQHDMELEAISHDQYQYIYQNKRMLHVMTGNIKYGNSFGGCLVYQALAAAYETIPYEEYYCSGFNSVFIAGTKSAYKVKYVVEILRDGKNCKHRQVRAYQSINKNKSNKNSMSRSGKNSNQHNLVFTGVYTFMWKHTNKPEEVGPQPMIFPSPIPNISSSNGSPIDNPFAEFGNKFDLQAKSVRDSNGDLCYVPDQDKYFQQINALDILSPHNFKPGNYIFENEKDANGVEKLSNDTISNRSICFWVRVKQPSADYSVVDGTSSSNSGKADVPYLYQLAMSYISDHNFIISAPLLLGYEYGAEAFKISLDHSIYFQESKHQTTVHDWHFAKCQIVKMQKGRVLLKMAIHNCYGELVALVSQEAFCVIGNKDAKRALPTHEAISSKL